ncbi:hypothetical protein [Kineococcus sp. SYSU DK001]|uniref:hypothetical protein n=1 Tax=Kineococcus sp. SYSU DK001 TaxID=3383122 RepID=UPI003D7CE373
MDVVLDGTVLRTAELARDPLELVRGGAVRGGGDVICELTAPGRFFVVPTTERGRLRTDSTTDDAGALDRYPLVGSGERVRWRRGLRVPPTAEFPPVLEAALLDDGDRPQPLF